MFIYPWGDFHSLNLGWFLLQFTDWVEKIQEYLDNGGGTSENLANVIAPVFNAANSYQTGDYVLYNNELYKANQAVNPGTWDPDAWTDCLIVDEMGSGGAGIDNVARLMIAGQYSANFAYQKYGICRYNDKLWMANTDLPAGGEAWNATHWDEITVGAGLSGLRRSVETLSNNIVNIQNTLNSIKQHKRKVLFIGDSYGAQANSWVTFAAQYMGLTSDEYVNGSVSGIGFVVDSNGNIGADYNGFADAVAAITTDRESYTDVVICGGINDAQYDRLQSFLIQHIKNTIAYIKQNFINANVRIGFIGGALNNSPVLSGRTYERQQIAKYAYIATGSPYYLNGVENAIHQTIYSYSEDKLHPSATGAEMIGQAVSTALITGYASITRPIDTLTLIPPNNGAIQNQSNSIYYKNDMAVITFNNVFSATLSDGDYDVTNGISFTFNELYVNQKTIVSGVTYMQNGTTGALYQFRAELYQNSLTIFPLVITNNKWQSVPVRTLGFSQPLVFNIPSAQIN